MKIELRQSVEILGVIGIIASLIFVGLQLIQSQEIAIAGQYQARAEIALDYQLSRLESTGVSAGIFELLAIETELTDDERRALLNCIQK